MSKLENQPSIDELWAVVQEQRKRIEELEGKRRRGGRLRTLVVPLTAVLVGVMTVTPGLASQGSIVAQVSKGAVIPNASGGACTPASLTGDATNNCSGVTVFHTQSNNTNGGWVFQEATPSGLAIHATCVNGNDCWGTESMGTDLGVSGWSTLDGGIGVEGYNGGTVNGYGLQGHVSNTSGAGVYGYNSNSGSGLFGTSTHGYGATLSGGQAQLHLNPGSSPTPPTNGSQGDLYEDSTGHLWYCTVGANGPTQATWKQLA